MQYTAQINHYTGGHPWPRAIGHKRGSLTCAQALPDNIARKMLLHAVAIYVDLKMP